MKKTKSLSLFVFGAIFLFAACEKHELDDFTAENVGKSQLKSTYSLNNWMGSLSDNTRLSEISIPGSHDAGARYEPWPGTAICQNLTIREQLDAGTRFLDIRCRHIDDAFAIHHGSIYQHMNFDDVLENCWAFLNANPTESIILSVKEEYDASNNTNTFQETFDNYVAKNPGGWYLGATVPELGEVRGKIVLFRRFSYPSSFGLAATPGWADNTTFSIYHYTTFRVQDMYSISNTEDKWDAITSVFNEAKNGSSSTLFVNFTSGYKSIFWIPSITSVSNSINPLIADYFTTNTSGRFGVIPMDFTNNERNALIIKTNF
jgi:1-phosphatidylinositol phosphodiesterase